MKLLHAADLHLDSPFSALAPEKAAQRRQEQRSLLQELAELCNEQDCDLMLLAGDLFDSDNAYPDTADALRRVFASCRAQIFIAPGNHDCALPGSLYCSGEWPENVHIFRKNTIESVELPHLGCRIYGAAFTSASAPSLLEGFRAAEDGAVNLMVLHGDAVNAGSPYNAISRQQIEDSGLDYLALGHIHAESGLLRAGNTFYAWPGCAMGRGFDETGAKGVYLAEVDKGQCSLTFHPLAGRRYEILSVPAGDDPLAAVEAALPADTRRDIYRILLTGEADPVDLSALRNALEDRFFSLSLRDNTVSRVDLWAGAGDDTLRGMFLQELRQQMEGADEAQRRLIEQAARVGLLAMEGREAPVQ